MFYIYLPSWKEMIDYYYLGKWIALHNRCLRKKSVGECHWLSQCHPPSNGEKNLKIIPHPEKPFVFQTGILTLPLGMH